MHRCHIYPHVFTGRDRMHVKCSRIATLFFLSTVRNLQEENVGSGRKKEKKIEGLGGANGQEDRRVS